jgi:hypothetical protein
MTSLINMRRGRASGGKSEEAMLIPMKITPVSTVWKTKTGSLQIGSLHQRSGGGEDEAPMLATVTAPGDT